jgi:hypothetical protein
MIIRLVIGRSRVRSLLGSTNQQFRARTSLSLLVVLVSKQATGDLKAI